MKTNKPIFIKSILSLFAVIGLSLLVSDRFHKTKLSFQQVSGEITDLSNTNEKFPGKDSSKYRYLQIDNFPKTFELFIGKDWGDFKPAFEQVDHLKLGDFITIYFDENYNTRPDPINRLAYFVDKGPTVIFIKGDSEKYLVYLLIGLSSFCILVLILLKKMKKIC